MVIVSIIIILLLIFALFVAGLYVVNAIFLSKIFKKAGATSWHAWVPILNTYKMLQLGGYPGWIALFSLAGFVAIPTIDTNTDSGFWSDSFMTDSLGLSSIASGTIYSIGSLISLVATVFLLMAMYQIGRKLAKPDEFVLLAFFLPIIWIIMLGADRSVWNESAGRPRTDQPLTPPAPPNIPTAAQA